MYDKYLYFGPVTMFGRIIADKWEATTMAKTKKKAKSNFIFQYKKRYGLEPTAKIELPGEIIIEGGSNG